MKFYSELEEAQLVPEWRDGIDDYKALIKEITDIEVLLIGSSPAGLSENRSILYGFSVANPIRAIINRFSSDPNSQDCFEADEENGYGVELIQSGNQEVKIFFEMVEKELEKVNDFYRKMEEGFYQSWEEVLKQLRIMLEEKQVLKENFHRVRPPIAASSGSTGAILFGIKSPSSVPVPDSVSTPMSIEEPQPEQVLVVEDVIAALVRNWEISIMDLWERLVNRLHKEGEDSNGYHRNWMKLQKVEKTTHEQEKKTHKTLVNLYKRLEHMNKYSSLNLLAFTKIIEKFTKVTNDEAASACCLEKVKASHFVVSDKGRWLQFEVESLLMKHFASNDQKIERIFTGLCTGSFVVLYGLYVILDYFCDICTSTSTSRYVETVYPDFRMFTLFSLHTFLYGFNLFMWKNSINHNFIFDFKRNTALEHQDAFLISFAFITGPLLDHLFCIYNHVFSWYFDALPGILLLIYLGLLVLTFAILYRETCICFRRVMRNIICSPFCKVQVLMADIFMADQLTSQIPLLRYMAFTACYLIAGGLKGDSCETCNSSLYKLIAYGISFLPYFLRVIQCIRKYKEDGHDNNHIVNFGKYVLAAVAEATRLMFVMKPTSMTKKFAIIACSGATIYQIYWDFVKDWGLMNNNRFLRDQLILKKGKIYYLSMGLNVLLRLTWIESVMRVKLVPVEHRLVDFTLASLEIIRRGHWNYYRLENEHLKNVGKFHTMKAIPMPFCEMESD